MAPCANWSKPPAARCFPLERTEKSFRPPLTQSKSNFAPNTRPPTPHRMPHWMEAIDTSASRVSRMASHSRCRLGKATTRSLTDGEWTNSVFENDMGHSSVAAATEESREYSRKKRCQPLDSSFV